MRNFDGQNTQISQDFTASNLPGSKNQCYNIREVVSVELNFEGVVVGVMSLVIIGAFHPLVIWFEYHFTQSIWPVIFDRGPALPDRRAFHPGPFLCPSGAAGCCLHMEHPGTEGAGPQGGAGLVSKKSKAEIGRGPAYFHPLDRVRMVLYNYPAVSND